MRALSLNQAFRSELYSLWKGVLDAEKQIFLQDLIEFLFNCIGVMTSLAPLDAKIPFSGCR